MIALIRGHIQYCRIRHAATLVAIEIPEIICDDYLLQQSVGNIEAMGADEVPDVFLEYLKQVKSSDILAKSDLVNLSGRVCIKLRHASVVRNAGMISLNAAVCMCLAQPLASLHNAAQNDMPCVINLNGNGNDGGAPEDHSWLKNCDADDDGASEVRGSTCRFSLLFSFKKDLH